ncbi:MAG: hypothetical protein OXE42_00665 [Gammaproteobacteria bacterium]|nr:hypothetical protein [Gammaproteobacteria bacterium]
MAESLIPVDLYNPGQVLACLGLLEAADVLCGNAEGGFDLSNETSVRFRLNATGNQKPLETVLKFLAGAEIMIVYPAGIEGPWPNSSELSEEFPASYTALKKSDGKALSAASLPARLKCGSKSVQISHWLKGDERQTFKLFAGQQVGTQLLANMLDGDRKKNVSKGFKEIFQRFDEADFDDPFSVVCAVGGRFGFDARGGWDALRIGTSLDKQGILVSAAPHVELLAAIGLENTRPNFLSTYEIQYAAWLELLPLTLCRVALFAPDTFLLRDQCRFFRAHLGNDKQYKECFFAELEE